MSTDEHLRTALKSQYHAALAMLRDAVAACPDATWYDATPRNAFWQVAYHALFFAHVYLQPDSQSFRPWPGHQMNTQNDDGIAGEPDPNSPLPLLPKPYSRADVLEYWEFCNSRVDTWVDALDLTRQDCGFHWYHVSKLEHQLVNLRHIQHHAAQLADRLRAVHNVGVRWAGSGRAAARQASQS
jgi:hypothetical protein